MPKAQTYTIEDLRETWKYFKKEPTYKQYPKFLRSNFQLTLAYFSEDVLNNDHQNSFTTKELYDDMLASFHDQIETDPTKEWNEKIVTKQIKSLVDDFDKFIKQNQWSAQKTR